MAYSTGGTEAPPTGRSVAGTKVVGRRERSSRRERSEKRRLPRAPGQRPPASSVPRAPRHKPPRVSPTPKSPPYNALESPFKTQGQFNAAAKGIANSQVEPELNQLTQEEQGETGLHAIRGADNVDTYTKLTAQSNAAFEQAKSSMAEIAARSRGASEAGQASLQAALSNTGVAGLGGVANPSAFMQEATGLGNESNTDLAKVQSGIVGQETADLATPGAGLTWAQKEENQRSDAQLAKLGGERKKVLSTLPNLITKARADLAGQESNREASRLQSALAGKKLGFEEKEGARQTGLKREENAQKASEFREAQSQKAREFEATMGIENGKLALGREELAAKVEEAKGGKAKAAAELAAKRWDNGLSLLSGVFKPFDPKSEYEPDGNPAHEKQWRAENKIPHAGVNPEHIYNALTKQAFMTAPEAFQMMEGTSDPNVIRWAQHHLSIFNRTKHNREYPIGSSKGAAKKQEQKNKQFQPLNTKRK